MKQRLLLTLLAAFLLGITLPAQAADETHWYEVTVQKGTEVQSYAGITSLSPEAFAKKVKEGEVIELDDLVEFTNRGGGGAQRWQKVVRGATEARTTKVYVNSRFIISYRQFSKDPTAEEKKP
jgi:hypothetical protein